MQNTNFVASLSFLKMTKLCLKLFRNAKLDEHPSWRVIWTKLQTGSFLLIFIFQKKNLISLFRFWTISQKHWCKEIVLFCNLPFYYLHNKLVEFYILCQHMGENNSFQRSSNCFFYCSLFRSVSPKERSCLRWGQIMSLCSAKLVMSQSFQIFLVSWKLS